MNLPNELNYSSPASLPAESKTIPITTAPSNGSSFSENSQINLDLVSRGFLVPDSMYISYKYTATTAANSEMKCCPVYTPFVRQDVLVGSQVVDSIQNYNNVMNVLSNGTLSVSEKYGLQSAYGYKGNTGTPSLEQLDGRLLGLNETGTFSGPLMSILSNSEKLIPLFAMGAVRVSLTLDSIANMFTTTVVPTGFAISDVQLHYKIVDFGQEVESMIRSSAGEKLNIKSQSFSVSSQTLASGATGSQSLIFNQRLASIKSLIALNGTSTAGGNGSFDSVNLKAGTSYQFQIAGINYPQRPINTSTARASALLEFKSAMGSIFDRNNAHSISSTEFNYDDTDAGTSYTVPGKFYVGTSVEVLSSDSDSLFTGVSTENSPITYQVNLGGATDSNSTVTLIANFDAILELDMIDSQVSIRK